MLKKYQPIFCILCPQTIERKKYVLCLKITTVVKNMFYVFPHVLLQFFFVLFSLVSDD